MLSPMLPWIIAAVFAVALVALVIFTLARRKSAPAESGGESLRLLLQQMNELTRTVDKKIGESTKQMGDSLRHQFGESQRLVDKFIGEIKQVTEKVARVEETGKQMVGFADQLQSLQDILKNPKQRGILGEYYLETLLKNVLPPGSFQMQYAFADGTIVDAAVFVKDKVIPVDSKFSLENYNRLVEEKDAAEREQLEKLFKTDLKGRIDETAKYVKPAEGTMDFAFMFIPHEAIYYDLLVAQVGAVKINTRDLIEYAFKEKHVIIVSPTSFLAYLQTVLQGLNALHIEESAKSIRANVESLEKHLRSYSEYHQKLGNALGTVVNHYTASGREFKKIDKDILKITDTSIGFEPLVLEKPMQEE